MSNGLLALLVRLVSGRLLHDIGTFAKREVRLVAVAVVGFVISLTFLLGAAAIAVVLLYTVLAPRLGSLESFGVLIGAALVIAVAALLIAINAASSFTRWEGMRGRQGAVTPLRAGHRPRDDASVALLISLVLERLIKGPRRASR